MTDDPNLDSRRVTVSPEATRFVALGKVVATASVSAQLNQEEAASAWLVERVLTDHQHGQWGNVPPEDAAANNYALANGDRILSAYDIPAELAANRDAETIWVITEARNQHGQRETTTVLYPHEY